jgi:hypothetical protein
MMIGLKGDMCFNLTYINGNIFTQGNIFPMGTYYMTLEQEQEKKNSDVLSPSNIGIGAAWICSSLIEHDDNCTTSYLVDLSAHVPYKVQISISFPTRNDSRICVTRQTLAIINSKITKISNVWTSNKDLYIRMSVARELLMGDPLPDLASIKQGYLIALLRYYRSGSQVTPFYDLGEQWTTLLNTEVCFKTSSLDVHANLMKLGLLTYFDVNKYLTMAFESESWKVVRQIMTYYGNSTLIDRPLKLRLRLKLNLNTPPDIAEWLTLTLTRG